MQKYLDHILISTPTILAILFTLTTHFYYIFAENLIRRIYKDKFTEEPIKERTQLCYYIYHQFMIITQPMFAIIQISVITANMPISVIMCAYIVLILFIAAFYVFIQVEYDVFNEKIIIGISIPKLYTLICIIFQIIVLIFVNIFYNPRQILTP